MRFLFVLLLLGAVPEGECIFGWLVDLGLEFLNLVGIGNHWASSHAGTTTSAPWLSKDCEVRTGGCPLIVNKKERKEFCELHGPDAVSCPAPRPIFVCNPLQFIADGCHIPEELLLDTFSIGQEDISTCGLSPRKSMGGSLLSYRSPHRQRLSVCESN